MFFQILHFFRYYFDLVIDKILGFYYNSKQDFIKKPKNPIVLESATSLADKIRKKEVTAEEIVQAFIDQINEVNPIINAIVDNRFGKALNEAREVDKKIARGEISKAEFMEKPFLGIPFTIKESTACKGLAFTFGLIKRLGYKATFDADYVAALKRAGGILLGVSNIPQFNLWLETINPVYGLTKNPYNTTRTVGGSAGGEASNLAACGSPLGVGTDIGGSSRIPSFMCGVFGHKLSSNLISTKGMTFRMHTDQNTMVTIGLIVKYVEDLIPFIKVVVGENANKLKLDYPVDVKKIKIYYVTDPKDYMCSPFRDEMRDILASAVEHFKETSSETPEELAFEDLGYTRKLWRYWMSQEPNSNFRNDINNREGEISVIKEIIKHFSIGGEFTTGTIFNLINTLLPNVDEKWALEKTETLRNALMSKLDENSVLLYPSAPFPARYHNTAFCQPFNFGLFAIWNVMKFPVTQVPMGLGNEGLPLGIQVVAAPFQDRLCVSIAKELERRFGGYVPPFSTDSE